MRPIPMIIVAGLCLAALAGCATRPEPTAAYFDAKATAAYVAEDYATARQDWSKALQMEGGNAKYLNNLGYLLYTGMGGERDERRAVSMWRRAARMGLAESQWHLGQAYEEGFPVERSSAKAYAWFRLAIASAGGTPQWSAGSQDDRVRVNATLWLNQLRTRMGPDELMAGEYEFQGLLEEMGRQRRQ